MVPGPSKYSLLVIQWAFLLLIRLNSKGRWAQKAFNNPEQIIHSVFYKKKSHTEFCGTLCP